MTTQAPPDRNSNPASVAVELALPLALLTIYLLCVVLNAWVCDDAYITYRTVDNFVGGFGLRWNVAERVQAFTHPLWMFLMAAFYAVTREEYWTSLGLSVALSAATLWIALRRVALTPLMMAAGAGVLILSKSFIEFSTSGLENPLTHLLLAAFFAAFYNGAFAGRRVALLSLLAGLGALNRMDSILLFGPPLAWALLLFCRGTGGRWSVWSSVTALLGRGIWIVAAGFLPLALWMAFSLYYYGFPFPNTAYAKLSIGFPRDQLWAGGASYFQALVSWDFVAVLAMGLALVFTPAIAGRRGWPVAAGILLYFLYILNIGGDFMAGRFFAAPVLVAGLMLMRWSPGTARQAGWAVLVAIIACGAGSRKSPLFVQAQVGVDLRDFVDLNGIADERAYYQEATSLLLHQRNSPIPNHWLRKEGLKLREEQTTTVIARMIGFYGHAAGPHPQLIDVMALSDPLLSRLPAERDRTWRPGHFERNLPPGYFESVRTGKNHIHDRNLAMYYDRLAVVTRDPLDEPGRLAEIWKFNTGQYDHLLRAYPPPLKPELSEVDKLTTASARRDKDTTGFLKLDLRGLELDVGGRQFHAGWMMTLDDDDDWRVEFADAAGAAVAAVRIPRATPGTGIGLRPVAVEVPRAALRHGYSILRIVPVIGDLNFRVGRIWPDARKPLPDFRGGSCGNRPAPRGAAGWSWSRTTAGTGGRPSWCPAPSAPGPKPAVHRTSSRSRAGCPACRWRGSRRWGRHFRFPR